MKFILRLRARFICGMDWDISGDNAGRRLADAQGLVRGLIGPASAWISGDIPIRNDPRHPTRMESNTYIPNSTERAFVFLRLRWRASAHKGKNFE